MKKQSDVFKKNIKSINGLYADKIETSEKPIWYFYAQSKNSGDNFIIYTAGVKNYAYDELSPKRTSKSILENFRMKKGDVAAITGLGFGNTVEMLLHKSDPESKIICFEPVTYLVKQALKRHNFSKALASGRLIICSTADDFEAAIRLCDAYFVVDRWFILKEPFTQYIFNYYLDGDRKAEALINMIQCNVGTVMAAGKQIAMNDITNIPIMIKEPGIIELKGKFKGTAAVIVSTGPSLKNNIHLLTQHKYRDNVIIICVAQALRTLLGYGITPDYACTVDFGEVNKSHFDGLELCGVPLIALNRTYAPIFENWGSDLYVAGSGEVVTGSITDVWSKKGHVMQGGSVSHFALSLAAYFGCSRIGLIGQDLSYDRSMMSHVNGTDSSGKVSVCEDGTIAWDINDGKSCIAGTRQSLGYAITAPGYYGGDVITNSGLHSFATAFTSMAKELRRTCRIFNCTEGGVNIPGIRRKLLCDFLDDAKMYCLHPNTISREVFFKSNFDQQICEAIALCKSDIKKLKRLVECCQKGIETADEMLDAKGNDTITTLFSINHKASSEAHEIAKGNSLLSASIYKASREVAGQMNTPSKNLLTSRERLEKRVERNKYILNAAMEESNSLIPVYEGVLKKLEDGDCYRSAKRTVFSSSYFEKCLSDGNWPFILSTGMSDASRDQWNCALKMREKELADAAAEYELTVNNRRDALLITICVERAREIGQMTKRWKAALRFLKLADLVDLNNPLVIYGQAACLFMLSRYDESLSKYKKLLSITDNEVARKEMELLESVMNGDGNGT